MTDRIPLRVPLWSGALMLFLQACATPSPGMSCPPQLPVPTALMQPCRPPVIRRLATNEDLAGLASAALQAYERCAAQMEAVRSYYGVDVSENPEGLGY